MHSVRRVKSSPAQIVARRQKEALEIKRYRRLEDLVLARDTSTAPLAALANTTELLLLNPEHYTVWNIRRELLERIEPEEDRTRHLHDELRFLESLMPSHPKVYWLWNHRRWVLERVGGMWERELVLLNKMLQRDPRNFHGWAHRRWVLATVAPSQGQEPKPLEPSEQLQDELEFTTSKINENFSNFSAWHDRSRVLQALPPDYLPSLQHELEYAGQAIGMDPYDQSAWIYYNWLLEGSLYNVDAVIIAVEYDKIKEIYDEEDSVWCAQTMFLLTRLRKIPNALPGIVDKMIELDPRHRRRYESLLHRSAAQ